MYYQDLVESFLVGTIGSTQEFVIPSNSIAGGQENFTFSTGYISVCQWTASLGGEEKQKANVLALAQGRNHFLKPNDVSNTARNHSADKCRLTCSALTLTHQTAITPSCVLGFSFFRRSTYPCDRLRNPNSPSLCSLSVPLIGSDTQRVMLPLVWDRVCALPHCLSH